MQIGQGVKNLDETKEKSLEYDIKSMKSWGWGEGSVGKCLLKHEDLSWDPNNLQKTGAW